MYKLTTFRLNNWASLTCGESELKYFNFLFHYLKQLLPLFEGLGQVKKLSDLKPTQVLSCSTTRNWYFSKIPLETKQQSAARVFN